MEFLNRSVECGQHVTVCEVASQVQGQGLTTGRGENTEQEVLQIKTEQWLRTSVCVERLVTLASLNGAEKRRCSRKIAIAGPADNTELSE